MLTGKVIPNAIGIYKPGSASGAAILMAAGTSIYDALAESIARINLLTISGVTN